MNSERESLLAMLPDKWEEFKNAFKEEGRKVSERSHLPQFGCDEPNDHRFHVNRVVGSGAVVALAFTLDSVVPRIIVEDYWNESAKDALGFVRQLSID